METYKFNENTILHSVGFDFYKLYSILTNGIVSQNEAKKEGIIYSRNYFGNNLDDYISMTRYFYSTPEDDNSCYKKYVLRGISLIVENQEFIYDQQEMYFNHADEVFVKDKIPTQNIVGLTVPKDHLDTDIKDFPMLPLNSTSYVNIKHCCDNLLQFINKLGYTPDIDSYTDYLRYLYETMKALREDLNDQLLLEDFKEAKYDLDYYISNEVSNCFKKILNKDKASLGDVLDYINEHTLNLPIYNAKKQYRVI